MKKKFRPPCQNRLISRPNNAVEGWKGIATTYNLFFTKKLLRNFDCKKIGQSKKLLTRPKDNFPIKQRATVKQAETGIKSLLWGNEERYFWIGTYYAEFFAEM